MTIMMAITIKKKTKTITRERLWVIYPIIVLIMLGRAPGPYNAGVHIAIARGHTLAEGQAREVRGGGGAQWQSEKEVPSEIGPQTCGQTA